MASGTSSSSTTGTSSSRCSEIGSLTETEAFLVRVCRQKLDLDTVDRQSDLRRLGADSLFLIELAVEIEDQFDIYVPAEAVEDDTRIFRIAEWIEAARVVR